MWGEWNRGVSICSNALTAEMAAADSAVHRTIRREVLRPHVVSRALTAALDALENERSDGGRLSRLEHQLAEVQRELGTSLRPPPAVAPLRPSSTHSRAETANASRSRPTSPR